MILVGNKVDMANKYGLLGGFNVKNDRRMVSYEEGEEFAEKNGMMFFESSGKTGENVKEVSE